MTDRSWAEMAVAVYAAMVEDRHHFAQASYRDGQWYFMLGHPGKNINGEQYSPVLGKALLQTLLEPVGQWCVFWWPNANGIGTGIRAEAVRWLAAHRPAVRWIPDRPIAKAMLWGLAAPFFAACRTRRVVLVGPRHLEKLDLFPVAKHIICPDAVAWQHVDRLSQEVLSAHEPDDLVFFAAGHASNLLIHRLWPTLKGKATLMDIGATLDPYCGVMSRGEFRDPKWLQEVMHRNHPDGKKLTPPPAPAPKPLPPKAAPAPPRRVHKGVRRAPAPPPAPRRRPVPRAQVKPAPRAAAIHALKAPTPPPPPLPDVPRPKWALILGGGQSVWEDVRQVEEMLGHPWDGVVIAANDVGCHWKRELHHWVTLHGEKIGTWMQQRRLAGNPDGYITWSRRGARGVDRQLDSWGGGSSGLLAVSVAAHIGCEHMVLCGIPMTREPHFTESKVHARNKPWSSADSHWRAWIKPEIVARMKGKVRSMSGRTRDLLGAPDPEWLQCIREEAAQQT